MRAASLSSTTILSASVARHAASLKAALRRAFSLIDGRGKAVPQSKYISRLKKAVLSSLRCKAVEIVCALVVDLARRGSVEEAEAIGHHLVAIARAEHAAAYGAGVQLSVSEAQLLEEEAEGVVERAEMAMAQNPNSLSHKLAYLAAAAAHQRARKLLDEAVRREVAAA